MPSIFIIILLTLPAVRTESTHMLQLALHRCPVCTDFVSRILLSFCAGVTQSCFVLLFCAGANCTGSDGVMIQGDGEVQIDPHGIRDV